MQVVMLLTKYTKDAQKSAPEPHTEYVVRYWPKETRRLNVLALLPGLLPCSSHISYQKCKKSQRSLLSFSIITATL